jgi:sulfur carrier protein ThiS
MCGTAFEQSKATRKVVTRKPTWATGMRTDMGDAGGGARTRLQSNMRHVLLVRGSDPIDLSPDRTVVFGRIGSGSDIEIRSTDVERHHAQLAFDGNAPILRDLGGEQGTRVNGQIIKEHGLQDGDEIRMGPFTATYRRMTGDEGGIEVKKQGGSELPPETIVAGYLENMSMRDLLTALDITQKTGVLELDGEGVKGTLYFKEGEVQCASCVDRDFGEMEDEEALGRLLSMTHGRFSCRIDRQGAPSRTIRRRGRDLVEDYL